MSSDHAAETRADTGPLPELPPAAAARPGPTRARRYAVTALAALAAVAAFVLLTRQPDPMLDSRPAAVAQDFAAALEARDVSRVLSLVEPTVVRRELSPELRAYVEHIAALRFESPAYALLDNDGEVAHVRWTATVHYTVDLGSERRSGERELDTTLELVKIEGTWYIRGVTLPET